MGMIADIKGADMRHKWVAVIGAISLVALLTIGSFGQQRGRGGRGEGAGAPEAPTNKTSFWSNDDIQNRWKDNEAKKTINSRLFNAPYNISTNVRIVLPDDPNIRADVIRRVEQPGVDRLLRLVDRT